MQIFGGCRFKFCAQRVILRQVSLYDSSYSYIHIKCECLSPNVSYAMPALNSNLHCSLQSILSDKMEASLDS